MRTVALLAGVFLLGGGMFGGGGGKPLALVPLALVPLVFPILAASFGLPIRGLPDLGQTHTSHNHEPGWYQRAAQGQQAAPLLIL